MTDTTKSKGPERRRHLRFQPLEITLSVVQPAGLMKIFGAKGDNIGHSILDLSESGMRVCLTRRVVVGKKVTIEFSVKRFKDSISLAGDVLWLAQHPVAQGIFVIGVRFDKVNTAQAQVISGWRSYFSSPAAKHRETSRLRRKGNDVEVVDGSNLM